MVTPEGVVEVLDFGLAKLVHDGPSVVDSRTVTERSEPTPSSQPGLVAGTVG